MNRFGCWVCLTIHRKDGWYTLSRSVELPFAPYPGLQLVFDEDESDYAKLRLVEFSCERGAFWCYASDNNGADDCLCGPADNCCVIKRSEIAWAKRRGWEMEGKVSRFKKSQSRRDWQFTDEQMEELRRGRRRP